MRIFNGFDELADIKTPVLTIGTFDGVHLGHQKILQKINDLAENIGGESILFTFYPHPRMVLFPDSHGLKLIQTQEEKLEKLDRFGLQNVIVYPFTKAFSRLTAHEFVRDFLVNKLKVRTIVIGYDHQFGKNREGSLELLKELAPIFEFDVVEIPAQDIEEVNVSSTKIRKALENGDLTTANQYLGEAFQLNGIVIAGKKIGRSLSFPTANLNLKENIKLIPKNGVYAVKIKLENNQNEFNGMLNIGQNPTTDDLTKTPKIEVHIFDFNKDIYGKKISISLLQYIREEIKFENLDALKKQLINDEKTVRDIIADF